jgi:glucose-6-phosphate 1-dehydrogenase
MAITKEPTIVVIFGCMGDLTWRKLAPALYNILLDGELPERFAVVGLDIRDGDSDQFRLRVKDGVDGFCECGQVDKEIWNKFAGNLVYIKGDFSDPATYAALDRKSNGIFRPTISSTWPRRPALLPPL